MSFLTQKFANSFPDHSTIRRDESSLGQRFLSLFSDIFESKIIDIIKVSTSFKLFREDLEVGSLYMCELLEADFFEKNDAITPTVKALVNGQYLLLQYANSSEDFLYGIPSRLETTGAKEITRQVFFTHNNSTKRSKLIDEKFPFPERVFVSISNSTLYKVSDEANLYPFGGETFVRIEGYGVDHEKDAEVIRVSRDGIYKSEKIYTKLTSVEFDGFEGDIEIKICEFKTGSLENVVKENRFVTVTERVKTGICLTRIYTNTFDFETGSKNLSFIGIRGKFILNEKEIKNKRTLEYDEYIANICDSLLVDSNNEVYEPVDFLISSINSRAYILDTLGRVHICELKLNPFKEKGVKRSTSFSIISEYPRNRVKFGENILISCISRKKYKPIQEWEVKSISPTGIEYWLRHRYDSRNGRSIFDWVQFEVKNSPIVEKEKIEDGAEINVWANFRYKINIDEIGQWDFITTAHYEKGETKVHKTSIMCEFLKSTKTFDTGVQNPEGISFLESNELAIKSGSNITVLREVHDVFLLDGIRNRIITRENYEEIEVEYAKQV